MSSLNNISTYLNKRGISGPWKIGLPLNRTFNQAIVIPAYSEFEFLPDTLESINQNKSELLKVSQAKKAKYQSIRKVHLLAV